MGVEIQSLPHNAGRGVQSLAIDLYSFSLHSYILTFFLAEVKTNFANQEIFNEIPYFVWFLYNVFMNWTYFRQSARNSGEFFIEKAN